MARKRKKLNLDIGELAIGIMGMLMIIGPVIFVISMCISKMNGLCQTNSYGEMIYIKCSEIIKISDVINNYKASLYLMVFGIAFVSLFILIIDNKKDLIRNCLLVIFLYIIAWILSIYLTSSFIKSLVLLCLHHFLCAASIGIIVSELVDKKHQKNRRKTKF